MSRIDGLRHRLYVLFRGERYDDEVKRELRFHRELDAVAAHGNSLGNETYYREEVRRMTLQLWIDRARQDTSYAIRGLRRSRGFTAAVVLILGLGVGVNAAMFSILDRVFLRMPNAVQRPSEIRRLYNDSRIRSMSGADERYTSSYVPYPRFSAIRSIADPAVGFAGYTLPDSDLIRDGKQRIPIRKTLITEAYFSTLGIRPERGRFFAPAEYDIAVPTPLAVISDALWVRAFRGSPSVLGHTVKIGATTYTIIGVAERDFTGIDLDAVDVWVPLNNFEAYGNPKEGPWYTTYQGSIYPFARTRNPAEATLLAAVAQAAIRRTHVEHSINDSTTRVLTGPIVQALGPAKHDDALRVATRVEGVAVMVLLIVIANVLNLLLLRAQRRRRELAVRRALGVSHQRLLQQMTVESLCLALLGGVAAVVFAIWASIALQRVVFPGAHWNASAIEPRSIWFVGVLSIVIGFIGGMIPAIGILREDLAADLKAGMKGTTYRASRTRHGLLAFQAALCVVLLIGAGLFTRSLDTVRAIGTGYEGNTQFFARATFDEPANHQNDLAAAVPEIVDRLRTLDGVEAVGGVAAPPMLGFAYNETYVQGRDSRYLLNGDRLPTAISATPGYFAAVGLRLIAGRDFTNGDTKDASRVVAVSAEMARTLWPGESAIGKCLFIGSRTAPCSTIVAVIADAHRMSLIERPGLQYYFASAQMPTFPAKYVVVRARPGRINAIMHETDAVFRQVLPGISGLRIQTFDDITERELRPWRLGSRLFTWLGALALIVAAVGVYAVIAYGVSQRTHEMGVRLALGARGADVVDLILRDALLVLGAGIASGIVLSLLLGRAVASLLFGVVPSDPSVIIGASTVLCVVGAAATLLPGLRAARIDPVSALRAD